jgi:integrase/recombinase XerD
MEQTSLTPYQFTIDAAIAEWIANKQKRTGSAKTATAYRETMASFRAFLHQADQAGTGGPGFDVLSNPIDIARIAALWANIRLATSERNKKRLRSGPVAPSTYNQRLAILSSFYTFVQHTYKSDIPNPIKDVAKRPVQAYAAAVPLSEDELAQLDDIDRETPAGRRNYAMLAVALATGRRASEITGLHWRHVRITGGRGKQGEQKLTLTFEHCKGDKTMHDELDRDVSAILLDYLSGLYGKQLGVLPGETPLWVSYSRYNAGEPLTAKALARICEKHLGTVKAHTLRHTFVDGMLEAKSPITELAARLGHSSIVVTQRYANRVRGAKNPYAEQVTAFFGLKRRQ